MTSKNRRKKISTGSGLRLRLLIACFIGLAIVPVFPGQSLAQVQDYAVTGTINNLTNASLRSSFGPLFKKEPVADQTASDFEFDEPGRREFQSGKLSASSDFAPIRFAPERKNTAKELSDSDLRLKEMVVGELSKKPLAFRPSDNTANPYHPPMAVQSQSGSRSAGKWSLAGIGISLVAIGAYYLNTATEQETVTLRTLPPTRLKRPRVNNGRLYGGLGLIIGGGALIASSLR